MWKATSSAPKPLRNSLYLSLRLLSVGRHCKQHAYRLEPWPDELTFQTPEGKLIDVELDNYVPHILSSCSPLPIDEEQKRIQCVPAFTPSAGKHADSLEDNDDEELKHASACQPAEQIRSGTPNDPSLKSVGGVSPSATETLEAPVAEAPSIIKTEP